MTKNQLSALLQEAVRDHDPDLCASLLQQGADPNVIILDTPSLLHQAAQQDQPEICRMLVEYGANVHARDNIRKTPLHAAASKGCMEAVRLFVDHGSDHTALDANHRSPLELAVISGHVGVVRFFLEECKHDVSQLTRAGITLDRLAQDWGEPEVADYLNAHRNALKTEDAVQAALQTDDGKIALRTPSRGLSPL